jgi:hypothetical protein
MSPFDRALALRALAFSGLLLVVATGVVVATDEPLSTLAMRVARLAALAPALAALGAAFALAQTRTRGETRALGALGASPWRLSRGARWAGWAVGLVATAAVASPWSDARALFPAATAPSVWHQTGAALLDRADGVRVAASGALGWLEPERLLAGKFTPSSTAAALAVAAIALAAPAWVSAPLSRAGRVAGAVIGACLFIVSLHAVAAGRIAQGWLVATGALLLAQAAWGHVLGGGARRFGASS